MVRWSCTPVKLWCAFAGLNRTSGYSGAKMMRVHSPRAQDERAPAPAPATSFADAVLKAPEPPRERFKWTAQRTVLYVVAFGMATWLTAFIITYMLVQVLLRVTQQ